MSSRFTLNTVQPHHEEYNINKYIAKIFSMASFDKVIPNYDGNSPTPISWDRASFMLMTNLSKLPCVESVGDASAEFKDLKFTEEPWTEIKKQT